MKRKIRRLFPKEGPSRRQARFNLENFHCDVIYDTLREAQFAETKYITKS